MKKGVLWWLSIPAVLGGYYVMKKLKNSKLSQINYIIPEDKSFDLDEKSLSVVKTHVTKNIKLLTENCNWFTIGKTTNPEKLFADYEANKIILLAKTTDLSKIQELEKAYTEKYEADEKASVFTTEIDKNAKMYHFFLAIS